MRCVSPGHHWVTSPLTGHRSWMPYPCGHCVACLHNEQDAWAIRLNEEAKHTERHEFIYDTLTFSSNGMPFRVLDSIPDETPQVCRDLLSRYSKEYTRLVGEEADFVVPFVTRDIIRDWIRRARELFVFHHGFRPAWKYVVFMEYGPKTSRPHFHLMFFNITLSDYVKYLAKPWRRTFGFTKTKLVSNESKKGRQCISRYVSKYCSKGVFESPLVACGLAPKTFRCISHGIGEGYLNRSSFASFKSETARLFSEVQAKHINDGHSGVSMGYDYDRVRRFDELFGSDRFTERFFSSIDLLSLSTYVDESSFRHVMPRYYKNKLLQSHKPNYLHVKIQDLLQARISDYYSQQLFEFALRLGYHQADQEATFLGFSFEQFTALSSQFASRQAFEARSQAEGCYVKLKNHYLRPLRNKAFAYVS